MLFIDQGVNSLVKVDNNSSQGPFRIAVLLEVGVFPTIIDSLAVEVMLVEGSFGEFGVEKTF